MIENWQDRYYQIGPPPTIGLLTETLRERLTAQQNLEDTSAEMLEEVAL